MAFILKGNDYLVSISGGYLFVTLDGNELATISVPSPVIADNYRNSISKNDDAFQDEYNNHYTVTVRSSSSGVDWKIIVTAARPEDEAVLMDRINVEYQPNGALPVKYNCDLPYHFIDEVLLAQDEVRNNKVSRYIRRTKRD